MAGGLFDFSQVAELAADLGRVSSRALPAVDKVVEAGAENIEKALEAQAAASTHFHGMSGSFSHDRMYGLGSVGYEIGPDKARKGGALGNIFFFGGSPAGGGTGDLDAPLYAEEPRFVKALGDVLGGLL